MKKKLLTIMVHRKPFISMDSSLMARIDGVTKNRSAFLAKAATEFLGTRAG
jgi:hypothetical protein